MGLKTPFGKFRRFFNVNPPHILGQASVVDMFKLQLQLDVDGNKRWGCSTWTLVQI